MAKVRPYSESERARMKELYESGMTLQATATALGRSLYGVYYRLMKMGVPIRSFRTYPRRKLTDAEREALRGRKHSPEVRRKMSEKAKARGTSHNWYVDGQGYKRAHARLREMNRLEYRLWREAVFRRDDFTCQGCGERGGNLQADHIEPWHARPDLRYVLSNGRTLCHGCHVKTPSYGRNRTVAA